VLITVTSISGRHEMPRHLLVSKLASLVMLHILTLPRANPRFQNDVFFDSNITAFGRAIKSRRNSSWSQYLLHVIRATSPLVTQHWLLGALSISVFLAIVSFIAVYFHDRSPSTGKREFRYNLLVSCQVFAFIGIVSQ